MSGNRSGLVWIALLLLAAAMAVLLLTSPLVTASSSGVVQPSPSPEIAPSATANRGSDGPIGRHCGGIGSIPVDWCGCTWGAVYFQGDDPTQYLEGATVEIHFGGDYVTDTTADGIEEEFPYYAESADRLGASEGDTLTLVARCGEYQTSLEVLASPGTAGEQRVDLVFPFPRPTQTITCPIDPPPPPPINPQGWPLVGYDSARSYSYPYSTTSLISNDFDLIWSITGEFRRPYVVRTGDVNGDGWLEMAVVDGSLLRLFSHEGEELWSREVPGISGVLGTGDLRLTMLADATGDGNLDIFVVRKMTDTEAVVYAYDGSGNLVPSWSGSTGTMAVARDGYLKAMDQLNDEHVLLRIGSNFVPNPRGAAMVDAKTGSLLWMYRAGRDIEGSVADMDGDGIYEILSSTWVAVHNGSHGCGLGWNTCTDDTYLWVILLDENGREIFTRRLPGYPSGGWLNNRIVDLDADGQQEILVAESHSNEAWHSGTSRLFLLDQQGDVISETIAGPNVDWRWLAVADVNADGFDEVVLGGPSGVFLFNHNLALVAQNPNFHFVLALNDINGDGLVEIITSSEVSYELAILGSDLQPLWSDPSFSSHIEAIISDLTGNGTNEIIAYTDTELRIYAHQEEPLPTPTPYPTPTPSGTRTLFLVNEDRLVAAYSDPQELSALHQLTSTVETLAAHSAVSGTIVHLEDIPEVVAAYDAWLPHPGTLVTDTTQCNAGANLVTDAIMDTIRDYTAANPAYWNIVLLGDDRIIPFRRVPDASPPYFWEGTYDTIVPSTTVGAAMEENYILTDDFYGDLIPNGVPIPVAHLPDHPVGRLVERPSEMLALVDAFLARDGTLPADPALVVGHDLVTDAAQVERAVLQEDGITTDALLGDGWTTAQFHQELLETAHNLGGINTHARHNAFAAPIGSGVRVGDVLSASYPPIGAVLFSPGCHVGLNVPPAYGPEEAMDLSQALSARGVSFLGNTGWGIGDRSDIAYSEALVTQLTAQLVQGTSTTLGESLLASKLAYIANKGLLDGIDEKILLQFVLYGLPMYRLSTNTGLTMGTDTGSPLPLLDSAEASTSDPTRLTVWYQPPDAAFAQHSSPSGAYYTLDGQYQAGHDSPWQPRRFAEPEVSGGLLHGAVFRGGIYSDVLNFDPVVAYASIITGGVPAEGTVAAANWYPAIPFQVLDLHPTMENREESFVVQFGQFRPADDTLRLFSRMSFDLYYSTSEDFVPPLVSVSSEMAGGLLQVQVIATDPSGIHAASVAYAAGDGHWRSIEMTSEIAGDSWLALLPLSPEMEYLVQVVDGAGNVTIDDNNGYYYRVDEPIAGLQATNDGPTALGNATTFTATVTSGSLVSYVWDLGDGIIKSGAVVTHTYSTVGDHTAIVTAVNPVGSLTATITAVVDEPIIGLTVTSDSPTMLGATTTFSAAITAGSRVSYTWDLGDGTMSFGAVITHTYQAAGDYTAVVTASNSVSVLTARIPVMVEAFRLYLPLVLRH